MWSLIPDILTSSPQKSIKVQNSIVVIAITPVYADNLVSSTLLVKFFKYQVVTPQTDITTQRAYHRTG
tara:strand:+ start:1310 stop:1513 length:204 start_codon:yes stop_codon:yes gene_type:complete